MRTTMLDKLPDDEGWTFTKQLDHDTAIRLVLDLWGDTTLEVHVRPEIGFREPGETEFRWTPAGKDAWIIPAFDVPARDWPSRLPGAYRHEFQELCLSVCAVTLAIDFGDDLDEPEPTTVH